MGQAEMLGMGIILAMAVAGWFLGTVRSLSAFIGIMVASSVTQKMLLAEVLPPQGNFVITFAGIAIAFLVGGILLYGATRMEPIASMEGVFGTLLGAAFGWGIARFIFIVFAFYHPGTPIANEIIAGGTFAADIYNVSPWQWVMGSASSIRGGTKGL